MKMRQNHTNGWWAVVILLWACIGCQSIQEAKFPTMIPIMQSPESSATAVNVNTSEPKYSSLTLGYYTGSPESYDSLIAHADSLDFVSVDVYGLDSAGNLTGADGYDVVHQPGLQDIDFYVCINNWNSAPSVDYFDPEMARIAIVEQRQKMISQLVALAVEEGYTGVNIDFENLTWSADLKVPRREFTRFIHELAEKLHQNSKQLIISVPAKHNDDPNNDWAYPFDLAALGREADYLQLMTYDQHGPWSYPGPVSGVDWVEECLAYTTSIVEPEKLLIGLPAYGYDWNLDRCTGEGICEATSFAWKNIPALLERPNAQLLRDAGSESPSLTYVKGGQKHVAWFEDQISLQSKVRLIHKYHLAGLSVWALGMDDLEFWQIVTQ